MNKLLVLLVLLFGTLAAAAETPSAFVIGLKGEVFLHDPAFKRPGTALRMLSKVPAGSTVVLQGAGSSVTLTFSRGGKRIRVSGNGSFQVLDDGVTPARGLKEEVTAPPKGGPGYNVSNTDLSRFGAMPGRALGIVYVRQVPMRIDYGAVPREMVLPTPGLVPLFWREAGEPSGPWKASTVRLEHNRDGVTELVPEVPLPAGKAYQFRLQTSGEPADLWVFLYSHEQLAWMDRMPEFRSSRPSQQDLAVRIEMLRESKLYDEALALLPSVQDREAAAQMRKDLLAERTQSWKGVGN